MNSTDPGNFRVLVIDDNDAIHADFQKTLESRSSAGRLSAVSSLLFDAPTAKPTGRPVFEVEAALQGQEGYEKVQCALHEGRPYAMAFVDMRMPPGWDGLETIQHLWKADPDLQVVICSAYSDYSWDQIIAKLGATDRFLILKKPFDGMEVCQLATALTEKWKLKRQAVMKLDELESLVHARTHELRRLAHTDKLTDLPNRAALMETLKKCIAGPVSAADSSQPASTFALHFVDFDRFKSINDLLGHEIGDKLLVTIADRFRSVLRQGAGDDGVDNSLAAFRLGGDEFVVLQRGIQGAAEATSLSEKLLHELSLPYSIGEHEVTSTASIGIALGDATHATGAAVLSDADCAMYRAKALGKARCVLFCPEMRNQELRRITLENDLRHATQCGNFFVCYQPVVSLENARLVGFEALLRWQHPVRGLISPAEFIPIAEESGEILAIGQWVIEESLRQLADWRRRFPEAENLSISVNCSRKQLGHPGFPATIQRALHQTGIPPSLLNLEITESVMMEHLDQSLEACAQLRSIGVGLHMDDFGTGYSSLSLLHRLPLSVLKIDRSFIKSMTQRREYAAVVAAILALAHNLKMAVIAEGVETADDAAMLCALECDCAQGYYFAKPLTAPDAERFIFESHGVLF